MNMFIRVNDISNADILVCFVMVLPNLLLYFWNIFSVCCLKGVLLKN